jgi:hypothetical protein
VTLLDKLNASLLDNKERLRRLEGLIEDMLKAAQDPDTELGAEQYLAFAAELREEAEETRKSIARLEKLRSIERSRTT